MMNTTKIQDACLELCDVIANPGDSIELCEAIVAGVESGSLDDVDTIIMVDDEVDALIELCRERSDRFANDVKGRG